MNEKLSKRRIQIIDLQKKEIEEKQEIRLLIRLHIFYLRFTNPSRIQLINFQFFLSHEASKGKGLER